MVDREHEVPATVEVTAAGALKVDSALDEDLENVDDAARVGHRAGTRAARPGPRGGCADLLVHGGPSVGVGREIRVTRARALRSYDRPQAAKPARGWHPPGPAPPASPLRY